jgi:hypothetical protein
MAYLAELVANPGRDVAVLTLAGGGVSTDDSLRQPVLDDRARRLYRRRVQELTEELEEAEGFADLERASRARVELDAVVDELRRAAGLGGAARPFAGPRERARTSVTKALRRAIRNIEDADRELGEQLRRSVHTGSTCRYEPVAGLPDRWEVDSTSPG